MLQFSAAVSRIHFFLFSLYISLCPLLSGEKLIYGHVFHLLTYQENIYHVLFSQERSYLMDMFVIHSFVKDTYLMSSLVSLVRREAHLWTCLSSTRLSRIHI